MKLGRLLAILSTRSSTKLYVVTDQFCLCGHASRARESSAGLHVRIGASVRVPFATGELIREERSTGTLLLTEADRLTRRHNTHRRHLSEREIPEAYFAEAIEL